MEEKSADQGKIVVDVALRNARRRELYAANAERIREQKRLAYHADLEKSRAGKRERSARYYASHRELCCAKQRAYIDANRDRIRARQKEYYAENREKRLAQALYFSSMRQRRMAMQAIAKANSKETQAFIKACPPGHHVDHIVPLRGKNVSGLHVYWNMQYLPAKENLAKSNKYE